MELSDPIPQVAEGSLEFADSVVYIVGSSLRRGIIPLLPLRESASEVEGKARADGVDVVAKRLVAMTPVGQTVVDRRCEDAVAKHALDAWPLMPIRAHLR